MIAIEQSEIKLLILGQGKTNYEHEMLPNYEHEMLPCLAPSVIIPLPII